jgi:predicted N-acetyltransferase YhbS
VRADAEIRPMTSGDVEAADRVAWAALEPMVPDSFVPADDALRARRGQARIAHLLDTDPGGAWVAERGGAVVGVALALVRERVWGLSLLTVAPRHQGGGIGGRLLAAALGHADGARGGIILSSTDPRAMRRYHRAGFRLLPAVALAGPVNASRIPAGLRARSGHPDADRATIDAASRHVRGASHAVDVPASVAAGTELLVLDDRGFALHREGSPVLVAARDEEAARDLLWSSLAAAAPGGTIHIDFVTAGNDWAVQTGLDAGLALSPDGPVFVRGEVGPLSPYLPSGAYL